MATSMANSGRKRAAKAPASKSQRRAPRATPTSGLGPPATVGVRELRQNLSVYLDLVKQGVAMQVTEHGRVVALLAPISAGASRLDTLLAQGLIAPATRSIRSLPAPRPLPAGARPTSDVLDELGRDRF